MKSADSRSPAGQGQAGGGAVAQLALPAVCAYDEPCQALVSGLRPGAAFSLELLAQDDSGVDRRSRCAGHAAADGTAQVPLQTLIEPLLPDAPLAFLESLPQHPNRAAKFVHSSLRPLKLALTLRAADLSEPLTALQERPLLREGVQRETVRVGDDVRGELFWPTTGGAPRAGVLLLAGSGGGLDLAAAAVLAREGIATFTQALFAHADLPPHMVELPVERVQRGLAWFAQRLGHRRIVLRGISKGSEMALRAALRAPEQVAGLVLWVPSPMATTGRGAEPGPRALLTEDDQPVPCGVPPHDPGFDPAAWGPTRPYRLAPVFDRMWRDTANVAYMHPVHLLRCPTLVMSGSDDGIWPSALAGEMLQALHARQPARAPLTHLCQPGAGHGFNLPFGAEGLSHLTWHPRQQLWLDVGGTPAGNGAAARAGWRALLDFIHQCTA
jgi:pimeloyl-ACP methyl ester carboxylesterase